MKIRIQGNSIRYRLRQPEVEHFKKYGSVIETIQLGKESTEQLQFVLQRCPGKDITIQFAHTIITIHVPQSIADRWTDSDLVGFDAIIEISNDEGLGILVEKDFKCLDGSDEEEFGTYPNPAKKR